jgi:predicted phosphoribosyltransferase
MLMPQQAYASRYDDPIADYDDRYVDRIAVGRQLVALLGQYRGRNAVVLALPPGGVTVALEVAHGLRQPLEVFIARTFAVRHHPALAAGALSEGGGLCFNAAALRVPGVTPGALWREARRTQEEISALARVYRRGRPLPPLTRRTVILVDDGLGDGLVQLAALYALRRQHPRRCIVATPYASNAAMQRVARRADVIVALSSVPDDEDSPLGHWRHSVGDDDAAILLDRLRSNQSALAH